MMLNCSGSSANAIYKIVGSNKDKDDWAREAVETLQRDVMKQLKIGDLKLHHWDTPDIRGATNAMGAMVGTRWWL